MTTIRTPDDEVTTPGWFYPPFTEGWWYQGATYGQRIEDGERKPGHSPYAVDFNRRTQSGGWLQDLGDPVLAAADGTVAEVDKADGLVMLNHPGMYRTEYRHMQDITVKVGDKVQRGDRIGSIGDVAGSGRSTSPHLHHVHYRRPSAGKPFERIRMSFEGKELRTSVGDSDTKPPSWDPPEPVMVQGPPARATWQSAYQEAAKRLARSQVQLAACQTAKGAAEDALASEKAAHVLTKVGLQERESKVASLQSELGQTLAKLADCEAAHVLTQQSLADAITTTADLRAELTTCLQSRPDCEGLAAERDGALERARIEQEAAQMATDRALTAERIVDTVRRAVGCM